MASWLVEIRLKDWEPSLRGGARTVAYEEVDAGDEVGARLVGFDQFANRARYEPTLRRRMDNLGLTPHNCCAPEAVQI